MTHQLFVGRLDALHSAEMAPWIAFVFDIEGNKCIELLLPSWPLKKLVAVIFETVIAFATYKFPEMCKFAPRFVEVPIPKRPVLVYIEVVLVLNILPEVVWIELATYTFPYTLRVFPCVKPFEVQATAELYATAQKMPS